MPDQPSNNPTEEEEAPVRHGADNPHPDAPAAPVQPDQQSMPGQYFPDPGWAPNTEQTPEPEEEPSHPVESPKDTPQGK